MLPFIGRAREGLLSTRFYRYALFEGDAKGVETEVVGRRAQAARVEIDVARWT